MGISLLLSCLLSLTQDKPDAKPEPKPEPKAEAPKKEKTPIDVWFEDGLRFKTRDDSFEGRIGGRFLGHYRAIFDRPFENQGAAPIKDYPNTLFVRQVRIETEGTLYHDWGYKVQADFGTSFPNQSTGAASSNVSGSLRDGFLEWKRWKEFQIRGGQFLMPLSQEDYSSSRFIDFTERSVMSRLNPNREIGVQVSGNLFDGALDYFAVLSNGSATLFDQGRGISDQSDQKEGILAFRVKPFFNSGVDALKNLRLSLSGSYGSVDNISNAAFDLISTELSVMYLDSNAATHTLDGSRRRIIPQISWPIGPFCYRGEFIYRTDDLAPAAPVDRLRSRGWYSYFSCILTGEDKRPEERIVPKGEWGAVELAFRVAQLKMVNAFESGIYTPIGNAEGVTAFTFGVNWWITRNVRITWDLIREKYSDPVQFDTRRESMLMGTIFRFQVDF